MRNPAIPNLNLPISRIETEWIQSRVPISNKNGREFKVEEVTAQRTHRETLWYNPGIIFTTCGLCSYIVDTPHVFMKAIQN
jgi:hypothetical protein